MGKPTVPFSMTVSDISSSCYFSSWHDAERCNCDRKAA